MMTEVTDLNILYRDKKIGVLMGGVSGEREISLKSGSMVLESLQSQGFHAVGIDVDRTIASKLEKEAIDVAYIMLHGRYGEDGTIQGLLEQLEIPYTGSSVLASALSMNKIIAKKIFFTEGIPTPEYIEIPRKPNIDDWIGVITERLPFPMVIKPVNEGSSLGVIIADDDSSLREGLKLDIEEYDDIFVERFIRGASVTVGILGLDKKTRALPILELRPKNEFYNYEAKYTEGMTEFICPAQLDKATTDLTQHYALMAHNCLGCRGFSRVDMQVDSSGNPFVLEINTIPGMTNLSDLPAEAETEGMDYNELVKEILKSAPLNT
jgi:D-alanine-D-alanine ligase